MTVQIGCTVRDFDPAVRTCTVELTEQGILDTWITGVTVAGTINLAQLVYGTPGFLAVPDLHRICEAVLVAIFPAGDALTNAGGLMQEKQAGRASFQLDGFGQGSSSVTFSPAFSQIPTLSIAVDRGGQAAIASLSATGFTATYSQAQYAGQELFYTWTATGDS